MLLLGIWFVVIEATVWRHGWNSASDFFYSHGKNKSGILTSMEADYLAKNYVMHCGGNCDGAGEFSPHSHEKGATANAIMLRKSNPAIKNLFYFVAHNERELGVCSDADPIWQKHPEWKLHNSTGGIPMRNGKAWIDCRIPEYRSFVVDHLVDLLSIIDNTTGRPLFDGVYSDGIADVTNIPGVSAAESAVLYDACGNVLRQLQDRLDAKGDEQLVVINGWDDTEHTAAHVKYGDASMVDHFAVLQFVDKNTGLWIPDMLQQLLFDVVRSPAGLNRTLQIKTWPGLLTAPMTWGNYTRDSPPKVLQKMVGEQLNSALALFLLVAEDNMWLGYSW
jgi:hypothetical protein